jgi:soluble lytic murein transglycosylase-like protein
LIAPTVPPRNLGCDGKRTRGERKIRSGAKASMTLIQRMRIAGLVAICSTALCAPALGAPAALTPADAAAYTEAFQAADRGDFIEAKIATAQVQDTSLLGHLTFNQLMHPAAYKASFDDLRAWLASYADLPIAGRVFALAAKRAPAGADAPRAPLLTGPDWVAEASAAPRIVRRPVTATVSKAREAFYAGDAKRALLLAPQAGDWWIAGLAAYRLKAYEQAGVYFDKVSADAAEDPWLRAAGGYWASRAVAHVGSTDKAQDYLKAAAQFPQTFYGMIAERQVKLATIPGPQRQAAAQGDFVLASYTSGPAPAKAAAPAPDVTAFIAGNPRAHRAAALAQIGRLTDAGLELRAGLSLAKSPAERRQWMDLVLALNAAVPEMAAPELTPALLADYPIPPLEPKSGFTIDKALVYAIVRQESRFNPMAVSPSGAVGLMQLMPTAAARAAGDDKLLTDRTPLFDPAFNLRVGQDYITWLMERGVGYDLLQTVAAYNGGPGALQKTSKMLGDDADTLLIIECLPALETRNYVEKVMTAYWTYRRQFGQDNHTLEALARGDKFVDARLDR